MQRNVWSNLSNKSFLGYEPRLNKVCQVGLQLLRKTKFCAKYGFMDTYNNLSHFVPLSPMLCPTQGYPLRFLALIHMYVLPTRFQERFHHDPCKCTFYMLFILQLRPPLCVISPQHQPLINPNSNKNTKPAMM
jgi:hypothetical protein